MAKRYSVFSNSGPNFNTKLNENTDQEHYCSHYHTLTLEKLVLWWLLNTIIRTAVENWNGLKINYNNH